MIDLENVTTWPWGAFTCHTHGCIGDGQVILLQVPEDPTVHPTVCGGCHIPITDKTPALAP